MILNVVLLLILLSLEATLGLTIFFIYLSHRLISRRKTQEQILAVFVIALLLAIFYSLSWPLMATLVFVFYLLWQKLPTKTLFWQLFIFILLNLAIFALGRLQLNYFYLIHLFIFEVYL